MKALKEQLLSNSRLALSIFVVLGVITSVAWQYIDQFGTVRTSSHEVWGQFGDYFGGILNPILSFCAFVGLLFTLRGQHADGLKAEVRHRTQLDDARFFQLLGLISSSSENFIYSPGSRGEKRIINDGRLAIEEMWLHFSSGLRAGGEDRATPQGLYLGIVKAYTSWKGRHWSLIGSHFQLIHASIEFIAKSGGPLNPDVQLYMSLLKAKLSEEERLVAFYLALITRESVHVAVVMNATGFDRVSVIKDPLGDKRSAIIQAAISCHELEGYNFFR